MNIFHTDCNSMHHQHNGPYINETSRKAEIKDDFGHTRFVVILSDFDDLETCTQEDNKNAFVFKDKDYQVEVISYCYSEEPLTIYRKMFQTYWAAEDAYRENIRLYADLCKAETRHWQDIDLYAKNINYQKAKCCLNCKYCKNMDCYDLYDNRHQHKQTYKCTNIKQYVIDSVYKPMYDVKDCDVHHAHCRETFSYQPIMPIVEPFYVCDGFEFGDPHFRKHTRHDHYRER